MDSRNLQGQAPPKEKESSSDSGDFQLVNASKSSQKKKGPIVISFDEKLRKLISSRIKNDSQLTEYLVNLFCNIIKINSFDDVQSLDFIFTEKTIVSALNNFLFYTKQGLVINNGPVPTITNKPLDYFNYYYETQFIQLSQIGSGGQGKVFRAEHLVDRTVYAIKKIAIKCSSTNFAISLKEVTTLAKLDHINIVKYKHSWIQSMSESDYSSQWSLSDQESSEESKNSKKSLATTITEAKLILYIKMSLCEKSLRDWLNKREEYSSVEVINSIVTQILSALEYIHKQQIIHHDVNPCNIFIKNKSGELQVQLGDFGLACSSLKGKHNEGMGTPLYAAPEQLEGECYRESDIYSFGIVLLELLKPMKTMRELIEVLQEFKSRGALPRDIVQKYPKWVRILKMTSCHNPSKRPTASVLLEYLKSNSNSDVKTLRRVNYKIRRINKRLMAENKEKDEKIGHLKLSIIKKDEVIYNMIAKNQEDIEILKDENKHKDLYISRLLAQIRATPKNYVNIRVYEDVGGIMFG